MSIVAEFAARLGLEVNESQWEKGHEVVESLHHALEAYVGVEAIEKLKGLVEGFVSSAVEAKNLSLRLGITTDAVQELGYAAYVSNLSQQEMTTSMQKFSRGLSEAEKGTGAVHDALGKLHLNAKDLKKESLDQNIEELAEAFNKAGPHVNKTALAMELFGRSGPKMLQLLSKGKEGIVELRNEAEELGYVIGKEGVEQAEKFEESQKRLSATLTGLRNNAVQALLPVLQEAADALGKWVKENREAITSTLQNVIHGLIVVFRGLGTAVAATTKFFEEHAEIVEDVLIALGAVLAAFAIEAAIDWIIAFFPVIAVIAVLALLVYAIKRVYEAITGQELTAADAWEAIKNGAQEAWDFFVSIPDKISDAFHSAWESIKDGANRALNWIVNLPVIKQLIAVFGKIKDAYNFITGGPAGGVDRGLASAAVGFGASHIIQPTGYVPAQVTPVNVDVSGDNHITVNAAGEGDPHKLAATIKEHVDDHFNGKMRAAFQNLKGGKK